MHLTDAPLGQKSAYITQYQPDLLFPIARQPNRDDIGIQAGQALPFDGYDVWQGYEVSWLNQKGKPIVVVARFILPCQSQYLIESKSFKLYLNSFNQSQFDSAKQVKDLIQTDLSKAAGASVQVDFLSEKEVISQGLISWAAHCIDGLDVETDCYTVTPSLLNADASHHTEQSLCSHLLKSNCLVTGQPDWGSILIQYQGPKINPEGLLKYLISFRCHNEFHEHCSERIYQDIMRYCQPEVLTVYGCYTRRGGLDINPIRSSALIDVNQWIGRLFRQ